MTKGQKSSDSATLADVIVEGMLEKKAQDVLVMDLTEISGAICDYFVICHGSSTTQVEAIADSVEEEARKKLSEKKWHREGDENAEWILIDYVNVVAHVFLKESREYYNLENLWGDAQIKTYKDVG